MAGATKMEKKYKVIVQERTYLSTSACNSISKKKTMARPK
jgi:hypothetical protein